MFCCNIFATSAVYQWCMCAEVWPCANADSDPFWNDPLPSSVGPYHGSNLKKKKDDNVVIRLPNILFAKKKKKKKKKKNNSTKKKQITHIFFTRFFWKKAKQTNVSSFDPREIGKYIYSVYIISHSHVSIIKVSE